MRIAKLLVLGALFLMGSNAVKAVDGNVWTKPTVTEFASLVNGEVYYFYLPSAQLFFTQGNAYGTQASVGTVGLQVRVEEVEAGVYTLTDYVKTQSAWKMWWFVGDANIMYVDYNNQADFLWEIKDMGNNVYRLSPSALNPAWNDNTKFVGYRPAGGTTILYSDCTADEGAVIDWQLVPQAAGEAYEAQMTVYEAAMALKEVLDKGEAIGANVSDQVAVYNNTSSTLEELQAATEAAQKAVQAREEELVAENYGNATVENPVNVTKLFITNYTFTGSKYDGWSGTAFGGYNPKENAEHYNKTYDTYQNLTDLKEGVYKVSVNAFYRAGNAQPAYDNFKAQNEESKYAKLYAATATDSLTTSILSPFTAKLTENLATGNWSSATDAETGESFVIPNDMVGADEFFRAGHCNANELFIAVTDGNLKIGVRKDQTISGDWSIFDDFALTYYGNGDDAYKLILASALENIKDFTGAVCTQSYLDAYNAAADAIRNATTKEQILGAMSAYQTAIAELEENIKLWEQIVALQTEAKTVAADETLDEEYLLDLGDWADMESEDLLRNKTLTNDELKAEIERVNAMIAEAYRHPNEGADMTKLLVNADFENGGNGWTVQAASGGNVAPGGNSDNHCYEAWNNANFDIYQVVKNAPMGVYEISVKGFYRYGRTAYQSYLNKEQYTTKETCPVFIYMNANSTPFTNVYGDPVQITDPEFYAGTGTQSELLDDGTTVYFPNDMASAAVAFKNDMFMQSAYGLVAQEGDEIRIGVKGASNQMGDSWCIWDDFKLTFRGFQADVVKPVLEQAIADGEAALGSAIGKDVVGDLQAAIDEAKAVVNGSDGEAMFAALTKLFDMQDAVNASKSLFASLEAANEKLALAIQSAVASASIVNEAKALNSQITNGLDNHDFANSDVEDLMNQISIMINRLGLPQDIESASDANPVTCTTVIVNPAYVEGNDDGWTGQAAINATANDAEMFSKNFNYYQLIQGLPAGTYKVVLQGFYRYGGYVNDYDTYQADPTANNNAFLYATAGEDTVSVALHRLASQAFVMEELSTDWVYANEENKLAVPNSMTTAADAFQTPGADGKNLYSDNSVIVKVGEDGKLTIGLKKDVTTTDDWTIWTNWQLIYYGKNSTLEESGNPLSIENMDAQGVVSAELFTIDGTRASKLQRGINIVRETLSDGSTRVKKIIVK